MTADDQAGSTSEKRLVMVGASGMVGGYALRFALENPRVGRVTSIGRKKIGMSHPKLKEVVHRDFADCSALAETLLGQDSAVFCLGAYTGSVPDAELRKITVDYTVEFARVIHGGIPSRLHLPARLHLSRRAQERTKFQLPPVARHLSRVSLVVPQPGDSR